MTPHYPLPTVTTDHHCVCRAAFTRAETLRDHVVMENTALMVATFASFSVRLDQLARAFELFATSFKQLIDESKTMDGGTCKPTN